MIKNIIIILILSISIFAKQNINLTADEKLFLKENSPLRVHNEINWPPYNYFEDDKAKGFSIDYFNLLAKKLNIKVNYISGASWNEFMEMLYNNELDVIINISKNKQRAKKISFSSIFHIAANAIYVKKGNEDIDSIEKLSTKTIVMPKGFFAQKAIEKHYPEVKQILVDDSLTALKILSLGKADATIGKKNVLDYLINKNNIQGVTPTSFLDDNRIISLIRLGTSNKKSILRDIIVKAQKSVTEEELLALNKKWFSIKDTNKNDTSNFFTKNEFLYLEDKKIIKMCNITNLKPIEFFENDKLQGITIDVLKKVEEITDIKFISVKTKSWEESKEFLKNKKCDIIPTVTNSSELLSFANFTKPYLNYKLAIITKKDKPVVSSLNSILDKTMAKKHNSQLIHLLKLTNPDLSIIATKNDRRTLEAVSSGKAYFAIEPLPIASFYMSKYALNNLYISRYTDINYSVTMAVQNSDTMLLTILNKVLKQITEDDHKKIFNKWIARSYEPTFKYQFVLETILAILIIMGIFLYRQYILNKHNKKLQLANNEIERKTIQLSKQKLLFETLYNKSADGVLLIKNNTFISCNESSLKILNHNKKDIINKHLYNISPYKQPDGKLSIEKSIKMIKQAEKEGINIFEWVCLDSNKNKFWVEIVLTYIEVEEDKVMHTVIRDISNRKMLEKELENLNENLEKKIEYEIKKNELNTKQLIQQSRLVQMGEMISMIAHQWRQPLAAISATTNNLLIKVLIEDKIEKKVFEEELKLITDYSQHLSSTISDFRNFFKSDKEKIKFDLEYLILKSINIISTSIKAKNITLKTQFENEIILYSYSSEIQQVILNILKNSEDILNEKTKKNKNIYLKTYVKDLNTAVIMIHDNGGGVEEKIIDKIFDPYFSTKATKNGTGLGLYMSKIIINDHCKGNLKVYNEYDGATFLIELPIETEKV